MESTLTFIPRKSEKERVDLNKLSKRVMREAGRAIGDYNMIEQGDRVMVCLSGGKDSYSMLDILMTLRSRAPIDFEIIAVNLDQKQPGFPAEVLPNYLTNLGVPFILKQKTLIPSSNDSSPKVKRLVRSAPDYGAGYSTVSQGS